MVALLVVIAVIAVLGLGSLAGLVLRLNARLSTVPAEPSGPAAARSAADSAADLDAEVAATDPARRVMEQARAEADRARAEIDRAVAARHAAEVELETLSSRIAGLRADADSLAASHDARGAELDRREQRLGEREERIDGEARRLEARDRELAKLEQALAAQRDLLAEAEHAQSAELERIAGLSAADAKAEIVRAVESQAKRDAAIAVRDIEAAARDEGNARARKIVTLAIQRVASEQTAESVITTLHLPADDMKGRIIGREGRNIRAFETTTGVNLIIDDTPEAVLLSCFDPVRREIGRLTLEKLVLDGRIHPHRIEEVYERSRVEVDEICQDAAEDALVQVGITDLHPELAKLMGQLKFRTSYGQNVLGHLLESAHLAGIMASELGLDPALCKRCAFLHDIGKALTHEVEGSHAIIGAELARRYGEHEDVAHAIEAHHNEVEVKTVEAVLTQAADAISGGRPGARRESLEHYVKRLERIEQIASEKPGVERVFAMQAGREIRVMVKPEDIDDLAAQVIAREVAKQIEDELTYPGQIRVTVVRESRATEIAK